MRVIDFFRVRGNCSRLIAVCAAWLTLSAFAALLPAADPIDDRSFRDEIAPLLKKYCAACHSGGQAKGGVAFDTYKDLATVRRNPQQWDEVHDQLDGHLMPPTGKPQPSQHERQKLIDWINRAVLTTDCSGPLDPGRVTIRRLNRTEYNNTIRDLVGVNFQPAEDFPGDDVGYGFDNIGDVLSLPPLLMEKYLAAAERIAITAIVTSDPEGAPVRKFPGKHFPSVGEVAANFELQQAGQYVISTRSRDCAPRHCSRSARRPPRSPRRTDRPSW